MMSLAVQRNNLQMRGVEICLELMVIKDCNEMLSLHAEMFEYIFNKHKMERKCVRL